MDSDSPKDQLRQILGRVRRAENVGDFDLALQLLEDGMTIIAAEEQSLRACQQFGGRSLELGRRWIAVVEAHPDRSVDELVAQVPEAAEIDREIRNVGTAFTAWANRSP